MTGQNLTVNQSLAGFNVDRIQDIKELRSQATIFTHKGTGARVLHLFNEDPNNLFCICFRTPVYNNTGVPHILEHSVLSGSKKFPLKDPFKEMLKGSLQTFLNAITYPDKTMYPVSSQVEQDYYNLVDIYCDAVFNPLLSEMTFSQEGWHFDVEDMNSPASIKGIVYNEMKGVFSDFRNHVARKTMSELYPDTTYFFESGGEPEHITDLTYDQFKEFHAQYYHPSNSFTVLYGNIPSEKTLTFLQKNYLETFKKRKVDSEIKPQPIWNKERRIQFSAPSSKEEDGTASVILCWLLGTSTDALTALLGEIFSHYLFDNESSPLRRALIDSKLGEDLDDMCGFDSDLIQTLFCAGLRKTTADKSDEIRKLIIDTIKIEIDKGLDADLLEGSIRQIEFRLREITDGGHFPYNLMLAERAFRSWIYGGDPLVHLCFEKPLAIIKERKKEGTAFFAQKLQEFFIDNPHNLLSTVEASSEMGEELGNKTEEQAAKLTKSFTAEDKKRYHDLTKALLSEQMKPPTPKSLATLPKLNRSDLPPENENVPLEIDSISNVPFYSQPLFTAGINYLDIGFDLTSVPFDLLPYFPIYTELLTRCGTAGHTPEEMAKRVSLATGGITCSDMCTTKFGTYDDLVFKSFFHGKALPERFDDMVRIFTDIFTSPQLNNAKLLNDILLEMRNELSGAIVRSGHTFAISHASAHLLKTRYIDEILDGVAQLRFLDNLVRKNNMKNLAEKMETLHKIVLSRKTALISMTCEEPDRYKKNLENLIKALPENNNPKHSIPFNPTLPEKVEGIEISSSVNYIAQCWSLGSLTPEAMGEFYLLSRTLSTGFLWDKIRVEGGAYGGMALISSSHPIFSCASYRDPNIVKTLDNFTLGLKHVAEGLPENEISQSVIGTIGRMDQPRSPHNKGFTETISLLCNRPKETRQGIRDAILNSSSKSLVNRAQQLLGEKTTALTVFGSTNAFDDAQKEKLEMTRNPLLDDNGNK